MTFEYFNNFFHTTAAAATRTHTNTTGLFHSKPATCSRRVNIYHSHDKAVARNRKFCSYFTKIRNGKGKIFVVVVTTTLGNSTRVYPLKLRRKIRKTSRRKRRRGHEKCLQNTLVVVSSRVDDNRATATATTALSQERALVAPTTTTTNNSHKCKVSVNNIGRLNLLKNNNFSKLHSWPTASGTSSACSRCCCTNNTTNPISNCDTNYCADACNCSGSGKRLKIFVKNLVSLAKMPQTNLVNKITNSTHATTAPARTTASRIASTNQKYFINNCKRKRDQLKLKCEKYQQLEDLCALSKQQQQQQQQRQIVNSFLNNVSATTAHTTSCKNYLPQPATLRTAIATSSLLSSASCTPRPGSNNNDHFSTFLTQHKPPTTAKMAAAITTTATPLNNLTSNYYSRSTPSASPSPFPTRYSVACLTPARILNELFGVIFMTLLVLSICHNNVLKTSAAAVQVTRRDVVASSVVAVEQIIMANKNSMATSNSRLNERLHKRQYQPEHLTQPYHQKLTQTNNNNSSSNSNNHHHHHQQQQQHNEQPLSYLNQKEVHQQPLENNMGEEEDKSNHIFQPPQHETWPTYNHQQNQQHLTTQAATLSRDAELEASYNNTFQSLSIIDGDLTLAVDANQNLMTVEEEMLIAASGGAVGVGSNAVSLGNHLHDGNNDLGSFDTAVMGLGGFNVLPHNGDKDSMPIFDFGMPRNITARTGHTEAIIKCRVDRLDDKSVSWIRKRDLHILTVGTATYTSDKRFQVTESKDSREWTLHVKSPQARDSGIYECQVNTEPKMSMAFQLNVIEISPDAKAVITGPADLHFKVGSAIILTCIVHQPSVKDIGPIYWYRGEYMITPFDINESTQDDSAFPLAAVTPSQTIHNKLNVLEQNHHYHQPPPDGSYGGAAVGIDTEQMPQIVTNEIAQDFAQRIAMESQLGDTMKSRLRISNAQTSDTGNYTCQPTTASSASVMVHVINDENPAAMQKSGTNSFHSFHFKKEKCQMSWVAATIIVAISTTSSAFY